MITNGRLMERLLPTLDQKGRGVPQKDGSILFSSPFREDKNPSFLVWPDSEGSPLGGFYDRATGERGSLHDLVVLLGLEEFPLSPPPNITWGTWCELRILKAELHRSLFGVSSTKHNRNGRPYVTFGVLGTENLRVRYLDGSKPKAAWIPKGPKGGVAFGLAQSIPLLNGSPIYLVNGEPSVLACIQSRVPSACFCIGEGATPSDAVLREVLSPQVPIRIVYDRDKAGVAGALKLVVSFRTVGATDVEALRLPDHLPPGGDVDDLHRETGDAGLAAALKRLEKLVPDQIELRSHEPPTIRIGSNIEEMTDQALSALCAVDGIYKRGGELVRVAEPDLEECQRRARHVVVDPESPRIQRIPEATIKETLSSCARWLGRDRRSTKHPWKEKTPPRDVVLAVVSRPGWPMFSTISGLVEHPVVLRGGEVLCRAGFDTATGLYLHNVKGIDLIHVDQEAAAGYAEHLLDLVVDFEFADPAAKSAWLAAILSPLARYAFAGPGPLFLFDGNQSRVGKSLLAGLVGVIATGRMLHAKPFPEKDDEVRKAITTYLRAGMATILFDNVRGHVRSAALEAAITASSWQDRLLCENTAIELPVRVCWYMTANNAVLSTDLCGRVVYCRLETDEEHPEERTGFKYPRLAEHIVQNRPRYLTAAVGILAGYIRAGKPGQGLSNWGGFEGWSDLVRAAVVWAGQPDPCGGRVALTTVDDEAAVFRTLVTNWPRAEGGEYRSMTAADILRYLEKSPDDAFSDAVRSLSTSLNARSLGMRLRTVQGRVVADHRLNSRPNSRNSKSWFVEPIR